MALLNLGFRCFFLLAALFSMVSIGLWSVYYFGIFSQHTTIAHPFYWHAHEMVYGYTFAVIAGFLLTAVKNWTNIQTLQGLPLAALAACWVLARACLVVGWLNAAFVFDLIFASYLLVALARPIIAAKKWKQIAILSKVLILALFNIVFYLGVLGYADNGAHIGIYGGLYLIIGLIMMMSRRLLPFFIEKAALSETKVANSALADKLSLCLFLGFYLTELGQFSEKISGWLALGLFALNSVRLVLWHQSEIWKKPMLWVLYLAYGCITIGFLLYFLSLYLPVSKLLAIHAMSYGGIGMITLGMMARVSLGHTGRNVYQPPKALPLMFILLAFGTIVRVAMPILKPELYLWWIGISQGLWVLAFTLFSVVYIPMLIQPRVDGKPG